MNGDAKKCRVSLRPWSFRMKRIREINLERNFPGFPLTQIIRLSLIFGKTLYERIEGISVKFGNEM